MININRIMSRMKIKSTKQDEGVFKPQQSRWRGKLQSIDNFRKNSLEYYLIQEIIYLENELSSIST